MPSKTFKPDQFTPTQFDTAADKAKFANCFVRFVESGFKFTLFPSWFYKRLSMTFGHIAHYDIHGFYHTWFANTATQITFLKRTQFYGCWGDPAFTYCDAEAALKKWVQTTDHLSKLEQKQAAEVEAAERAQLAFLKAKYPEK
jgi:hypothetical protein